MVFSRTAGFLLHSFLAVMLHNATRVMTSLIPDSVLGVPGDAQFDYVIVGGGTAGLVVASRLAEAAMSVAVIEAGGFYEKDAGNLTTVPAYAVFGAGANPDVAIPGVDWGFVTSPQESLGGRTLHYARGKTLGGSSARNYFTYQRPSVNALNRWASLVDDETYSFESFLPYFKKSIDYTPPDNTARPENASVLSPLDAFTPGSGPLHVSFATWANPLSSFANQAWQSLGLPIAQDFVSGNLTGVQYSMNTINPDGQIRDTSYSSFLQNVVDDTPIRVYNNTLAKRILFNNDSTATGVLVTSDAMQYTIFARREVILSAGAFQSPQLLMVSGIGPADTLERLDIPIVSELNGVGQNMQDHFLFGASYQVNMLTHAAVSNPTFLNAARDEYNANGTGILSNAGGELIAWERLECDGPGICNNLSPDVRDLLGSIPADFPTFEFLMLDAYSGDNQDYSKGGPDPSAMYASPVASVMIPQSRGFVTITSNDTAVLPVISPNWLNTRADEELVLHGFRRMRQMMDTEIMKGAWVKEVLPGRHIESDEDILNAIKATGIQLFHASATCKMGNSTDPNAVVDNRGRPFGTKHLRVVDASAIPFLPPGHPQAVVYALAEKLSEDILRS